MKCFLIRRDVAIIYIFPKAGTKWINYAKRFASRYRQFFPKIPHKLIVVSNGGPPSPAMQEVFNGIQATWLPFSNSGWDIGAYQHCAKIIPCDIMVCFGASVYFRRHGWLDRMVDAVDKYGVALYGAMGHMGAKPTVWPHLRTTGFWFHPNLLNAYPKVITTVGERYEFEHGRTSFSEWCKSNGIPRLVVAFDGIYDYAMWNRIPNGYHRGDQSNLLCGDRLTEPPYYSEPKVKAAGVPA